MTDYTLLKVPELKKILTDRSLPLSGNKADLIARLQEDDKKSAPTTATASVPTGDDEIDWDEDDAKATATPVASATIGGQGQIKSQVAMPNQKPDIDPGKSNDLKAVGSKIAAKATDIAASTETTTSAVAPTPAEEVPKKNFTIGIQKTDAEKEAEKRAARAKRFGIVEDEEEKKKLERAKKFGAGNVLEVKGLDDALPERRAKRGREAADKQGGRNAKRQTPDRRTETLAKGVAGPAKKQLAKPSAKPSAKQPARQPAKRITDDPVEKAKAEVRAKRFQTAA